MQQYQVNGMTCAACSARVEKAVSKVPGVTSCSVNLLTNSMQVEGEVLPEVVIGAVTEAGYQAQIRGSRDAKAQADPVLHTGQEESRIKKRLVSSLLVLLILMYVSMGHTMFGLPMPLFFKGNYVAMGLLQLLLAAVVLVINQRFFISGVKSLWKGAPNMDTLVSIGSFSAFFWSVIVLFLMTDALYKGNGAKLSEYSHQFYFESAAMILTLITVGKWLETKAKGKTTDAIQRLMELAPKTATVERRGEAMILPVEQVEKGDILLIKPGENIPVDAKVIDGISAVDESALTGESIPVDKQPGDMVSAATINQSGFLRCEAVRVGDDTTLQQIIQMVSDASATKAPIAKIADKVSGVFVPFVIGIAFLTFLGWMMLGEGIAFALARAISVLVISCPCALGLATPVAIMVGNGVGARNGILFKTAIALEETGKADMIVLDKTGTITNGQPKVTGIYAAKGVSEEELLTLAYSLEMRSEHPLAKAVVEKAAETVRSGYPVEDFLVLPGNGLKGIINGEEMIGGSLSFLSSSITLPEEWKKKADEIARAGQTPLGFAYGGKFYGILAVADTMKKDSKEAIEQMRSLGCKVVMLTGDNELTAHCIAEEAGVDSVIAGVLPQGKQEVVSKLKETGKVIMVGDGMNDAPALVHADVGIALGAGNDIAIDAAQVILMKNSLLDVAAAIRLSRSSLRNIKENLFFAFLYNMIGIPLAMGVFYRFGLLLPPMFGAAAMSLSSFCVVSNALRLNFCKIYEEPKQSCKEREETDMIRTMKIKGMMCEHCENRVKKTLEALPQVKEAKVSYKEGVAVVTLQEDIEDETLKHLVEEQDYQVEEIG